MNYKQSDQINKRVLELIKAGYGTEMAHRVASQESEQKSR
jgi:hypothetical protein